MYSQPYDGTSACNLAIMLFPNAIPNYKLVPAHPFLASILQIKSKGRSKTEFLQPFLQKLNPRSKEIH